MRNENYFKNDQIRGNLLGLKLTELSRDNIRQKVYWLRPLFVHRFWKIEGSQNDNRGEPSDMLI